MSHFEKEKNFVKLFLKNLLKAALNTQIKLSKVILNSIPKAHCKKRWKFKKAHESAYSTLEQIWLRINHLKIKMNKIYSNTGFQESNLLLKGYRPNGDIDIHEL